METRRARLALALGAVDGARCGLGVAEPARVEAWDVADVARACVARGDAAALRALTRADGRGGEGFRAADEESGWSAAHAAVHYGELTCARALRSAWDGAFERAVDRCGRAAVDVVGERLARDRRRRARAGADAGAEGGGAEARRFYLHAWGSGANYALGTGSTETSRAPARVETLARRNVLCASTNKLHALAVDGEGRLFAWGCSRDGVLGLGRERTVKRDAGVAAEVFPTLVRAFGRNVRVVRASAGLSHSACVTANGDVYTWGCARHGRLGYYVASDDDVDRSTETDEEREERRWTQYAPKKVPNMMGARALDVSCGDAHTAILDADGFVWTFGSNARGQLGYFTPQDDAEGSHSATAKQVEYLKHRDVLVTGISSSKQHVVACSRNGDAYTWGHGSTAVRRVVFPKPADYGVNWHEINHNVVKVSAGGAHSAALTADGWLYAWESACEHPEARLLDDEPRGPGTRAVDVSCGATSSVVVTDSGEVYTWDADTIENDVSSRNALGTAFSSSPKSFGAAFSSSPKSHGASYGRSPKEGGIATMRRFGTLRRVSGLRGVSSACAGDAHFFAVQTVYLPKFSLGRLDPRQKRALAESEFDRLIRDIGAVRLAPLDDEHESSSEEDNAEEAPTGEFPTLKQLAEHAVANAFIEPRNVLDVAQLADQVNAVALKRYAMEYAIMNLDVVLLETPKQCLDELEEETLQELTDVLRSGAVVSGWSADALGTQNKTVESLEEIERAVAAQRCKPRAPAVVIDPIEVSPPKPPLAAHVVATSSPKPPASSKSAPRPAARVAKGSLSMFLSGELQGSSKTPSPPPVAPPSAARGTSFRDIQLQQERAARAALATKTAATSSESQTVFSPSASSASAFSIGDVLRRQQMRGLNAWKSPTPSGGSVDGGSPKSMREILDAEAAAATSRERRFTTTTGFSVGSASPDRWFVEPRGAPKSLREILDEERAADELRDALDAIEAQETAESLNEIAKSERRRGRRSKPTASTSSTKSADARSSPAPQGPTLAESAPAKSRRRRAKSAAGASAASAPASARADASPAGESNRTARIPARKRAPPRPPKPLETPARAPP